MLATLTDRRDFGDDWLLERKFDGERCVARRDGSVCAARVADRQGPHRHLPRGGGRSRGAEARSFLLDGEVVAYDGDQTSFGRLQQRLGITTPSAALVANHPGRLLRFRLARARRRGSNRAPSSSAPRAVGESDPAGCGIAVERSMARRL